MAAENSRRKLLLDENVEVRSLEDGFLGSWHSGTIIGLEDSSRSVQYDHLLNDESSRNLIENVKVSPTIDGVLTSENELFDNYRGLIRPIPSSDLLKPWCLHYGQCVDLFYDEAWWEGVIFDHEDGCEHRRIFFPDLGDEMDGPIEKLRLSKDWDELTEKWKPRGNWLFLELIEEAEQNWPLPVSVKQIWYEVRMKKGFEKLKEWTSSGRDIWRELVFQVLLDNFRITIKQLFMELDSSWHFEELGQSFLEFSESAIDFVLKTEELFRSSLAMVPFESTTIKMDTEEEILPIDLKNDDRVQEIQAPSVSNHALPILSHNHNEDSGIGSDNYDDTPGTSSRSTRKPRLKWRSVVPELVTGAEFCPEAIDDFNEILRSKKKPSANVNLNVRKHLLHLGWKIDFLPDSRISRLRYFSPDGKVFYSLRLVCEEFVNLCQDSAPGSEMVMSSNYGRKVSHEEMVFSPQSCDDDAVIEPEYCPEAVWDYYSVEKKDKEKKLKALKAKKHLSSIGWSFYYQMKGERKEIRYSSPTGAVYYSLIQACKWCIENNAFTSSDPSCKAVKDFDDHLSTNKSHPPLLAIENLPNEPSEVETCEKLRISRKRGRKPRASKVNENNNIDADYSPPVRRSKRAREMIATSSQQTPKTMLSWLIDNNVVLPRAKVQYRGKNNGLVMKEGRIAREGIKCSCCGEIFTVSKFETHAGSTIRRPSANIFLADGRSLMQCQQELRKTKVKRSLRSDSCEIKGKRRKRKNDYICSVCHYGGDLVLCDQCPSSFHTHCLGLKDIPDGDWFCPSCCCKICGQNRINEIMALATDFSFRICAQCEHRYHIQCLKGHRRDSYLAEGDWFCQDACEQIFFGLHKILGRPFPVGIENLTWTLVKYIKSDSSDQNASDDECLMENYSKLDVALSVMHECFEPVKEPGTKRDLVEDVIFSRRSELNRLNFQGFYTVLLEKNEELISAATVRIYGKKVAEVPLVATRFQYRRLGMCRVLMNELEKKLIELGVERLILPAVPSVLHTWTTSFGFSLMNETERLQFLDYTFLDFQGTVICQKVLTNNPSAVSSLSTVSPVSCENGKKSANIELDGNSTVSEVFQADQVEEIDMAEQGSMCIATDMDNENGNCPAQLAVVVVDQSSSLPNCLPFKTKISLECHPVEVAEDKPAEDNSEGLLKCYKRRKISAC